MSAKRLLLVKRFASARDNKSRIAPPQEQTFTIGRHSFHLSRYRDGNFTTGVLADAADGVVFELDGWPASLEASHAETVFSDLISLIAERGAAALVIKVDADSTQLRPLAAIGFGVMGQQTDDLDNPLKATWPIKSALPEPLKPAVIMGRPNPNMLSQIRALGRCGIPVYCLLTRGEPESIARVSCYVRGVINCQRASDEEIVASFHQLRERLGTPPVLFFAGDYDITLTARIWEEIADQVVPVTDPAAASHFNDKAAQAECVKKAGVPVPESILLNKPEDIAALTDAITFPMICRPVELARKGQFTGKILVVNDRAELEKRLLPILESGGSNILVQEYIPGGDETIFFAMAACGAEGEVSCMVSGRKLFEYPKGLMCIGETVQSHDVEDLARMSFKALKLTGPLGVEFKRDSRSGTFYYIEANLRPENFNGIAEASGVNIILGAYLSAIGQPFLYLAPPARPAIWQDLSLIVLSRLSGKRSQATPESAAHRVDAVWTLDDPLPAITWYLYKIGRVIAGAFNR